MRNHLTERALWLARVVLILVAVYLALQVARTW